MKVKYTGEYDFSTGLNYGDSVTVTNEKNGYIIGKTENSKTVVLYDHEYEKEV